MSRIGKGGDGASDRDRTGDTQDHNLVLYQLSYARHRDGRLLAQRCSGVKPALIAEWLGMQILA